MQSKSGKEWLGANGKWLIGVLACMLATHFALRSCDNKEQAIVRNTNEIVVASWNIGLEPVESRIDQMIEAIKTIDADILVVIELTPESAAQTLKDELQRAGMKYDFALAQKRERQSICVFYKPAVKLSHIKPLTQTDLGNPYLRQAFTAKALVGNFDFNLIAVHNKSKIPSESGDSTEMRNRQLNILRDYVRSATKGREKDAILIGTFNMIPDDDKDQFDRLNKFENLTFIAQPSKKAPFTFIARNGRSTSFIDGVAITKGVKEWVPGSFETVPLYDTFGRGKLWFREKVSDHVPIKVRFKTDAKDDD